QAIPIGGLRMIDGHEADDKVIAVLRGDAVFGSLRDVEELPTALVDRLRHYFLTYKQGPDLASRAVGITHVYRREGALAVIRRSGRDYGAHFGTKAGARSSRRRSGPRARRR